MRANPLGLITLGSLLLLAFAAFSPESVKWLDDRLMDRFQFSHAAGARPDRDIVLIAIDEGSIQQMAPAVGKWPWARDVYAELVEALLAQEPRAVVFDILLPEPDVYRPQGDAYLSEVIAASDKVYLPTIRLPADNDRNGVRLKDLAGPLGLHATPDADPAARADILLPRAIRPEAWRLGAINAHIDADGRIRRYRVYEDVHGWRLPSLPARVAEALGKALPEREFVYLDWQGRALTPYPTYYFSDLWKPLQRGDALPNDFHDKIVIIGVTATAAGDIRPTPIHSEYPGVSILATALDNLLTGGSLRPAPNWLPPLIGAALVLLVGFGFRRHRHPLQILAGLAAASLALLGLSYALLHWHVRLPVASALLVVWLAYFLISVMNYLDERRRRQRAMDTFGRFLDPRVVRQLVDAGEIPEQLRGQAREVTLLFSDIRGFTTLSETQPPEAVVDLLNAYFSRQVEVIFKYGGTLDKFIGDAIMAFWGAPGADPEHAQHAVAAALEMADVLEEFRRTYGLSEEFDVGIGVHSGRAVVGFIGSVRRQDYTAIGDTVNLASRIEGLTKNRARILVSEATKEACGDRFRFIDHGITQVKGRAQGVRVFEPRRQNA